MSNKSFRNKNKIKKYLKVFESIKVLVVLFYIRKEVNKF